MISKAHIAAVAAEFIGTLTLTLGMLTVTKSSLNLPFFISATAGLAAAAMMLLFGRISGAQLNPAITLGLFSVKRLTAARALAYVAAQLVGGITAYYLFAYFTGQRWHNTGPFEFKALVAETLGAFLFALGWAAIVAQKLELAKASAVVGLSLTVPLLVMSSAGAITLNPSVALGMRSWTWGSTVLGPILGAAAGFQVYKYLFAPEAASTKAAVEVRSSAKTAGGQLRRPGQPHRS